ncbi:MAG: TetR/AcrR family transcriptional regulator [Chloroflexota bacterium]|nr:TetR/AcrR family transcriptional regulator [Chloroflexota bacterium]
MPRVTPEHSRARRQQILDAARSAFVRDGFHSTSMLDVQREAGLSAGAIYLYFKSKDDIVTAIAADALATIAGVFTLPPPDGTFPDLRTLIDEFLGAAERLQDEKHLFPLIIQIWSEALRNPHLRYELTVLFSQVDRALTHMLAACQASGQINPDVEPESLAMALIGLGQGYLVQRALLGERTSFAQYREGVQALMRSSAIPDGPTAPG